MKRRRLLASMAGVSSAVWPTIWAPQPPTPPLYVSKWRDNSSHYRFSHISTGAESQTINNEIDFAAVTCPCDPIIVLPSLWQQQQTRRPKNIRIRRISLHKDAHCTFGQFPNNEGYEINIKVKKKIWAREKQQNERNVTHGYIFKCGREWQTVVVRTWWYANNRYLDDKYKWTKVQRNSVKRSEREHTLRSTKEKHIVYNWGLSKIRDHRKRREEDFRKNVQRQPFPQPCAETRRDSSRFLFLFWITGMWKSIGNVTIT